MTPWKSVFSVTEKKAFSWALKKRFSEKETIDVSGLHKKRFFLLKNRFYWSPEKAIFRKQKKLLFHGALKKRFFGNRNFFFFVAPWKSDLLETVKITFSWTREKCIFWNTKKSFFRRSIRKRFFWNKKSFFSWRRGKAIFRKPKE